MERKDRLGPFVVLVLVLVLILSSAGCSTTPQAVTQPDNTPTPTVTLSPTSTPLPVPTATRTPTPTPTVTPSPIPTPTPEPVSVRFAIIGDLGEPGVASEEVASLVQSWEPDFIVTTGDNNFPHGAYETIDPNIGQYYHQYIHPYQGAYGEGAATNRFWPTLGNHDLDTDWGQPYFDYFTLPGNERYYTVTLEPVTLFALNSMPGEPDGIEADSVQAAWLREALAASETPWNLVFFHHAAYTSGHRGPGEWMRWPFQEWGADAAFSGHNHTYERLMIDGFPFFVNGLAGAPIYAWAEAVAAGSAVRFNGDYGAMRVEATATTITFTFITRAGEVIDTFTLEQHGS
jgi:hypothetical protein